MSYGEPARPRGCDGAEVIQVIRTEALVGRGTTEDIVRRVTQYWSFDGELLAVNDNFGEPRKALAPVPYGDTADA